jgi:hypothetical protein
MKDVWKLSLIMFVLLFCASCQEKSVKVKVEDQASKKDADYYVVQLSYDFDNYIKNERSKEDPIMINIRNVFVINCDSIGVCRIKGVEIPIDRIKSEIKKILINKTDSKAFPSLSRDMFEYSGLVIYPPDFTILVKYHPNVTYKQFSRIRNEIFKAYNDIRNEFALSRFNKTMAQLRKSETDEDRGRFKEVKIIYPIRYSESEFVE